MNELKFELEGAFNAFFDEHKEYLKEYENYPASPHKPRYPDIDTTADEEFNVYCAIHDLSEKELRFLYYLITDKLMCALIYNTDEE